jgi:uncharacterized membrane protein
MTLPASGPPSRRDAVLERTFRITVILKGVDGVLELVGGMLLLFASPERVHAVVRWLTQHELAEDPHDRFANLLVEASRHLTGSATLFGALYLLAHGIVKVVLVWAVLRERLWAYPWMIAFLIAFIGFQCYRMSVRFTWSMLALTLLDLLIVALTVREYRIRRRGS